MSNSSSRYSVRLSLGAPMGLTYHSKRLAIRHAECFVLSRSFSYKTALRQDQQRLVDHLRTSFTPGFKNSLQDLNAVVQSLDLASGVCLRNRNRIVILDNEPYRRWFGGGESLVGRRADDYLQGSWFHTDQLTDQLMQDGGQMVRLNHLAAWHATQRARWLTVKFGWNLQTGNVAGIHEWSPPEKPNGRTASIHELEGIVITITRPVDILGDEPTRVQSSPSELLLLYQQLDDTDQRICQAIASGDSIPEVAAAVGLTRRSVENRRTRILDHFQFSKPVDIVRLIVRLEEHGLL